MDFLYITKQKRHEPEVAPLSVSFLLIIFTNCLFQFAHAHLLALSYNLHYHYALRSCRHRYGI